MKWHFICRKRDVLSQYDLTIRLYTFKLLTSFTFTANFENNLLIFILLQKIRVFFYRGYFLNNSENSAQLQQASGASPFNGSLAEAARYEFLHVTLY